MCVCVKSGTSEKEGKKERKRDRVGECIWMVQKMSLLIELLRLEPLF